MDPGKISLTGPTPGLSDADNSDGRGVPSFPSLHPLTTPSAAGRRNEEVGHAETRGRRGKAGKPAEPIQSRWVLQCPAALGAAAPTPGRDVVPHVPI
jgi:hypothetical protein